MTTSGKGLTRRAALAGLACMGGLAVAAEAGPPEPPPQPPGPFDKVPVTGKAGPGLEPLDQAMLRIMDHNGIPGAAFAVAKNGKLLMAKGYGWANLTTGAPAEPTTLFGLASLSKPLTAAAALKLVEQGKLRLDDPAFGRLEDLKPPRGARVDPRLSEITVRQCLNHSGGWDRNVSGDPANWEPQIGRALGVRPPLSPRQLLEFMLTQPLNFKPGTDQKYSNVGYILVGEVIAAVSGQPYDRYVHENVLKPMGITRAGLFGYDGKYVPGEAARHLAGTMIVLPAQLSPMNAAAGGWSASAVDMARFLTNLDASRGEPVLSEESRQLMFAAPPEPIKPSGNGVWVGLGWDMVTVKDKALGYFKDGSYHGMRTYMKRLPVGLNWVLLYNASMNFDPQDLQLASHAVGEVRQALEGLDDYPDVDLFKEFS
jgi:N-acyl-D-amino-acid deacylase